MNVHETQVEDDFKKLKNLNITQVPVRQSEDRGPPTRSYNLPRNRVIWMTSAYPISLVPWRQSVVIMT